MASTKLADRQILNLGGGTSEKSITFGITGVTTGDRVSTQIAIPFTGTILKWKLNCSTAITAIIDIKKNGTSVCAGTYPSITASTLNTSSTLTGWTTSVSENDILMISVNSKNLTDTLILQLIIQI